MDKGSSDTKILIVDDDPIIRTMMRASLEKGGYIVVDAADGEEACALWAEHHPDAVIADVLMPRMDGFQLCRELRKRHESAYVPILVATGLDDIPSITKAYDAGATDFISKPLNWVILNHRVRYMLRAARVARSAQANSAPNRISFAGSNTAAKVLIVDDDPIIRMLMQKTLENEGFDVIAAADGEEACDLWTTQRPDAIISDVVMPRMDGFELCRRMRSNPDSAHVPILVATGLDDVTSITHAYEAGATDFIAKPLNWVILTHRLRYMLRAARAFEDVLRNQQHLVAAKDAAEAANRAKSDFLANMSHELRTPLNAIIGFSSIMRDEVLGPLPEKYAEYAKDINESGIHLLAIINDILDLTRAEQNQLNLMEDEVELEAVVSLSMNVVQRLAQEAGVLCTIKMMSDPPALWADPKKLRQILINLLSNAVKFTPPGGKVTVTVELKPNGAIEFQVQDTGIGIPADKIAVALAPFGQVDGGLARKYDGVGLGLPLTKRLAELHGGTLEMESVPDKGTTVTVQLPRERVIPQPARQAVAS